MLQANEATAAITAAELERLAKETKILASSASEAEVELGRCGKWLAKAEDAAGRAAHEVLDAEAQVRGWTLAIASAYFPTCSPPLIALIPLIPLIVPAWLLLFL